METQVDTTQQSADLQAIPEQEALVDAETKAGIIAWLKDQRTPLDMVDTRTGRGGQDFHYIRHQYVTETLNRMTGYDWDFEVRRERMDRGQIAVLGRLTIRVAGREITKEQWGSSDVKESGGKALSVGDDFKSATSDALKKCASLLGLGIDMSVPARQDTITELNEACYEVFGEDNWQAKQQQAIRTLAASRGGTRPRDLTEVECRALTCVVRQENMHVPVVQQTARKLQ
jgi:hypothetical protein